MVRRGPPAAKGAGLGLAIARGMAAAGAVLAPMVPEVETMLATKGASQNPQALAADLLVGDVGLGCADRSHVGEDARAQA